MKTSAEHPTSFVPCSNAICGEVPYPQACQNVGIQYGDKSVPKCDQQVDNTSILEGASNLNLKANHCFSLRAECEKKGVIVVLPSASDKSVQDEVHQAPTNL